MKNLFDLKGKTAVVTGASQGIGQEIAIELARHGADVVVSDIQPGDTTIKKIKQLKRKSLYIKTDISNQTDVENMIKETIKKFNKIDILVNNAGIFSPIPTLKLKQEDWEKTIDTNLRGTFFCSQEALKHMKKGGSIINISSIAANAGFKETAAYSSSKGGITALTKELAAEFGNKGIRINAVLPGVIQTSMTKGMLKSKKTKNSMIAKIPLSRTGKPIDIAGPVVFLASEASSYITGQEIIADGGWTSSL